jgi:hypothetical protein
MSISRTVAHWLLALALIANAGLPSAASAMDHSAHQTAEPMAHGVGEAATNGTDCDDDAPSQVPSKANPATMDCCSSAGCTCSCLHHAPVVVLGEIRLPAPLHGWVAQLGQLTPMLSAPVAPAIRPPIA